MSDHQGRAQICRRYHCDEPALWRRMCAAHWARWQSGADPLDQPGDDGEAPQAQVWQPPVRENSVSRRRPPAL
ncbi:hypothetical protein [Amycolatopsis sp. cmx-4-68]|uniref:hypothetical protein n=1 Tax=Amycolatopsis sp. cmx-4-68 TaxID=2790938 RepID=UPI00397C1276